MAETNTQPNPLAVPDAWNTVAEGYAIDIVPRFSLYAQDALALAEMPPNAHILDVATGPGTLSVIAARSAERVVAIDFAEAMIEVLRRRIAEENLTNIEIVTGDGQSLAYDDETFDAAFSMFGLMFFPDRAAGFQELRRVLKLGRRAVVSSWTPMEQIPLLAALFGSIRSLLPGLPFASGKAPLSHTDDVRTEMTAAGFRSVEVHTVEHYVEIPSIAAFWKSQTRSSAPIALLRNKLSEEEWTDLAAGIVERLETEFGTGTLNVGWPALLGVGIR